MKFFFLIPFLLTFILNQAFAVTLVDALNQAYKNNTELNAERENISVSKEDLNITKGEYLPSASITGTKSQEDTNKLTNQTGGKANINDVDPFITSIKLEQKLVDFGRSAEFKKKRIGLDLAEAKLLKTEQDILYKATEAFAGLIVASEMLKINKRNLKLLQTQVESDKLRLERGQITISDLAQSESSLAGANAQFIKA
jgi:outer membrane protein